MIVDYKTIDLYGKTLFTWVVIKTPLQVAAPMPDEEACFTYILEGENVSYAETGSVKVATNQSLLAKCGNYVAKMFSANKEALFSSVTVHFHKEVLDKAYRDSPPQFLKSKSSEVQCNQIKLAASSLIHNYFEGVLYFFDHKELVTEEILILKLKEVILLLLNTDGSSEIQEIMSNLFTKRKFVFKEVIESHICSTISIQELAQLTNRSLSTFKKDFSKIYGDTPGNYLINRKLEKVAELLRISDESISNIAYDCGFKSASHLSRIFKEKYLASPSTYRNNS